MVLDFDFAGRVVFPTDAAPLRVLDLASSGVRPAGPVAARGRCVDPRSRGAGAHRRSRRSHRMGAAARPVALGSRYRGVAYFDGGRGGGRDALTGHHGSILARLAPNW